ncbi:FAD-dependent oxidoreductase [Rathayibacter oskolensis]|uniref:FAD-dependent oxidoreductase n=1 Tax=Rathayibacter oskolensis TaxID=1891671 RepID=UPI00265F533B|nr:FAD-dependent oxidoreductase [Rathayibacter oskolensis]WKK72757.1 FAD-dependent oxidoreductase [Rathayibacter oskolensis]
MTVHDAIVVGLGIHGSATAYELALRGRDVVGLEQFDPGHVRGSSHGATRMIRRAYPSPVWNDLVDRAFRGWERWALADGAPFVHPTGGHYAHRGEASLQGGRSRPVADTAPSLRTPAGYGVVHDPDAGVVEAARALAFAQQAAARAGADLRFGETVLDWSVADGVVTVRTSAGGLRGRRLVVSGGAWVGTLLPETAGFFEVQRILTLTVPAGQRLAQPPALGCFSVDLPEGLVFGLPEAAGSGAKIGIDAGPVWDPAVPVAPPTEAEVAHLAELLESFVPGIETAGGEAVACLYTMTPDKRFVVGEHPEHPEVLIAAACSGHGFKFGPAIGEALADLVEGVARPDLAFLSPARLSPARRVTPA